MRNSQNEILHLTPSDSVREFIKDTGLPLNKAAEGLGVSSAEFMNWWAGYMPKLIQMPQLQNLGQFLNIDEARIMDGRYDKNFVRSQLFAGHRVLPEKYTQNQFSYLRSSAHIIKFLNLTRGQHFSDAILRKLNVFPLIYGDLNNKISLNYFMDLLDMLAENGLTQKELDNLACVLFLSLETTPLGEKFSKARSYFECYEVLANNVHLFDHNFEYTFELDRQQLRIRAFLPFDSHTHINWSKARMDRLMRYRQILIGWYSYLSKLPPIFPEYTVEPCSQGICGTYIIRFDDQQPNRLFSLCPDEKNN